MEQPQIDPAQIAQRRIGREAAKTIVAKYRDGFIERYLSGAHVLDIGYRGYDQDVMPIVPQAKGIDLDYPGYDGKKLPFADESQDAVYSSHCLEHIEDFRGALREWHRVLRVGGFMVVTVPHQFLYERRISLPSRWNQDHRRFYTPGTLMAEVEASLEPNTYRLRHLIDNDRMYPYSRPPELHPGGCYEIEMVIEKIAAPAWLITDLTQVDVSPDHELFEWVNFGAPEAGVRWSEGDSSAVQFSISGDLARATRAPNTRIILTVDIRGQQQIRASLNNRVLFTGTLEGTGRRVEIPADRLRPGRNIIRFELPGAIMPASASDPRRTGIAVRKITLLRHPIPENRRGVLARLAGLWKKVLIRDA